MKCQGEKILKNNKIWKQFLVPLFEIMNDWKIMFSTWNSIENIFVILKKYLFLWRLASLSGKITSNLLCHIFSLESFLSCRGLVMLSNSFIKGVLRIKYCPLYVMFLISTTLVLRHSSTNQVLYHVNWCHLVLDKL